MSDNKETVGRTFTVVIALCLICSIFVAGSAVLLKPRQQANAAAAKQVSILATAGIATKDQDIAALFNERVKTFGYNLETQTYQTYDSLNALNDAVKNSPEFALNATGKTAGVRDMRTIAPVFEVLNESGDTQAYVIDIRGAGLWGMMYAFLAVEPDGETIKGIYFYDHSETPGLGGEIQNPRWTARFEGKSLFAADGSVLIGVQKNAGDNEVDALSGATLTSKGVDNTLKYWLGGDVYGSLFAQLSAGGLR